MAKEPEVSDKIKSRLRFHADDFKKIASKPFDHFFWPILHVDAPADLRAAHHANTSRGQRLRKNT